MSNPTKDEINKCLAEYEGYKKVVINDGCFSFKLDGVGEYGVNHFLYTDSLDACVPVVEKLNVWIESHSRNSPEGHIYQYIINRKLSVNSSPSLALATALYKVIKELK